MLGEYASLASALRVDRQVERGVVIDGFEWSCHAYRLVDS
jgi:hypothetical protein